MAYMIFVCTSLHPQSTGEYPFGFLPVDVFNGILRRGKRLHGKRLQEEAIWQMAAAAAGFKEVKGE